MACPPRAGDRVGAEAAWTEGLDINLVQRARAPHRERHAGARAHHRRRRTTTRADRAQQGRRWTGARASSWRARLLLRFATATPTVLTARPSDGHGTLPPLCPCALERHASKRAGARALCADARAWIDRDAAGSRVRDIIRLRWRDAHYYHRAAAVHRYSCIGRTSRARRACGLPGAPLAAHAPWQRGARAFTCPPRDEYDPQP